MKTSELKKQTAQELENLLKEKRHALEELAFSMHQNKVKNIKEKGMLKKDIARILTLLTQA